MKIFLRTFIHLLFAVSLISFLLLISGYAFPISNTILAPSLLISGAMAYLTNKSAYNAFLFEVQKLMMVGISKQYRFILQTLFVGSLLYLFGREVVFSFSLSWPLLLRIFAYPSIPNFILWVSGILLVLLGNNKQEEKLEKKKELNNKIYYFIFFLIVALGSFLRIYKLDAFDIRGDEFQVVAAAAGYLYTGDYYRWNWVEDRPFCLEKTNECYYNRAWPHTWMVAQSFKYFGVSEASARIPSVVFGIFFILISLPISRFFLKDKRSALFMTALVAFNPAFIDLSRYTRMYTILLPAFLLMSYFFYKGFWENFGKSLRLEKKLSSYLYLFLGAFLLWFNYHVHLNGLIIIPVIFVYFSFFIFKSERKKDSLKRKRFFVFSFLIGVISVSAILSFSQLKTHSIFNIFTFFGKNNNQYFSFIFGYPVDHTISILILFMGLLHLLKVRFLQFRKTMNYSFFKIYIFIAILLFFSITFFVYIADRYPSYVYTSHIIYFSFTALILSIRLLKKNLPSRAYLFLILFILSNIFLKLVEKRSDRYDHQGTASFSQAYKIILENYDSETQALFLQYPRDYYLRELTKPTIIKMLSDRQYTLEQFFNDASMYESGYVAWETGKSGHLQQELRDFIRSNFKKYHGSDIDSTQVEVFYFDKSAIPSSEE